MVTVADGRAGKRANQIITAGWDFSGKKKMAKMDGGKKNRPFFSPALVKVEGQF